jgi:hypothetical protein
LQELHAQIAERNKEVDARFDKILSVTENLLAIVRPHQDRLDTLEGGKQ